MAKQQKVNSFSMKDFADSLLQVTVLDQESSKIELIFTEKITDYNQGRHLKQLINERGCRACRKNGYREKNRYTWCP